MGSAKLLVIMEVHDIVSLTARVMSTFATNTFFGASFYINFVETPAKLSLNSTSAMVDQFQETFPRAMSMQFKLVVVSSVGSAIGWFLDKGSDRHLLLYSSLFMIFIIPWTKIKIMPINNQLMDGEYPKKKRRSMGKRHDEALGQSAFCPNHEQFCSRDMPNHLLASKISLKNLMI